VGGRYADLSIHDSQTEVAIEVHSAWGTFEWLAEDALRLGWRVGFCANSDDHTGRPGASHPGARGFGAFGGLTCLLAPTHDREGVLEALRSRHFYATTGHRALLEVQVDAGRAGRAIMGDVVETAEDQATVHVHTVGTAAIESVRVSNGVERIADVRPLHEQDIGRRVKIVWCGAEARGRDRAAVWDGELDVRGNAITGAVPVNLWNPNWPLDIHLPDRVAWRSITTGGNAGVILTLRDRNSGRLDIRTAQGHFQAAIGSIDLDPLVRDFAGLGKMIQILRLPDSPAPREFDFELTLNQLRQGDNPICVRVTQEDGHVMWSSPVYLHRTG